MKATKKLPAREKHRQPVAAGVEGCICYEAKPKDVQAYFSSFIYPEDETYVKSTFEVHVQTRDGEYLTIFSEPLNKQRVKRKHKVIMAAEIIRHYCGGHRITKLYTLAEQLVDWPGHSITRMRIHQVQEFLSLHNKETKK